jgi:hypothetical protein
VPALCIDSSHVSKIVATSSQVFPFVPLVPTQNEARCYVFARALGVRTRVLEYESVRLPLHDSTQTSFVQGMERWVDVPCRAVPYRAVPCRIFV